jgi:hypothetical protein
VRGGLILDVATVTQPLVCGALSSGEGLPATALSGRAKPLRKGRMKGERGLGVRTRKDSEMGAAGGQKINWLSLAASSPCSPACSPSNLREPGRPAADGI